MNGKNWTEGLALARKATNEVEIRIEKEFKYPLSYACHQSFIDRETEAWLKIRDVPRSYLTQEESRDLDYILKQHDSKPEEKL